MRAQRVAGTGQRADALVEVREPGARPVMPFHDQKRGVVLVSTGAGAPRWR
jgi:hypothetical protein